MDLYTKLFLIAFVAYLGGIVAILVWAINTTDQATESRIEKVFYYFLLVGGLTLAAGVLVPTVLDLP